MMLNSFPKHRLDAGSFGTMGVGLGFAIAAALYAKENCPEKRIICVEGDSAFGFSGMEMETIVRYNIVEVYRPVVPGGAGGAMAPPNFGRSVNPISTKGGRLCPPNNTSPRIFRPSDGPADYL